ncbi:HNH endonuclease [Lactococcus nasutitermitis]|uniref:Putative HNH nuclease YajD n=1 Tax=Lactococcus nasutitermitis TaxID=1652957 RepID=A0ABV9JDT8_9LACT|nr:HNH endonuclease [Lactococcus nasutitermitis]
MDKKKQVIDVATRKARHTFYCSSAWRCVRKQALVRDNYECQWCKAEGRVTTALRATLEVDHIKELEDYPEFALQLSNLRTLCHDCHNKRHHRSKEKKFDDECFEF